MDANTAGATVDLKQLVADVAAAAARKALEPALAKIAELEAALSEARGQHPAPEAPERKRHREDEDDNSPLQMPAPSLSSSSSPPADAADFFLDGIIRDGTWSGPWVGKDSEGSFSYRLSAKLPASALEPSVSRSIRGSYMVSEKLPLGPGMRVNRVFEGFPEWYKGGCEQFRCTISVGGSAAPGARLVPGANPSALVGVSGQGSNSILHSWSLSGSFDPATGRLCATKRYTFFTQEDRDVASRLRARKLKRATAAASAVVAKLQIEAAQMRENEAAAAKQLEASRAMTQAARENEMAAEKELARVRAEAAQAEQLLARKRSVLAQAQAHAQAQEQAQAQAQTQAQAELRALPATTAITVANGEAPSSAPSPHSDVEIIFESDSGASAASSSSSSSSSSRKAAVAATAPAQSAQTRATRGVRFEPHSDASSMNNSDEDYKPVPGRALRPTPSACAVCSERYKWNRSGTMRKHGRPLCAGSHKTLEEHDRMRVEVEQEKDAAAQAEPGEEAAAEAGQPASAGSEAQPALPVAQMFDNTPDGAAHAAEPVAVEVGGGAAIEYEAPASHPQPAGVQAEAATEVRVEAQADAEAAA